MLHPLLEQKFTHLFKILDFDHDGLLQESDFIGLSQNILIFRCIETDSEVEKMLNNRGKEIWSAIQHYLEDARMSHCNLQNWLKFLSEMTNDASRRALDILTRKAVRDIFFIYDENRDNYISKREYMCFFVSLRVSIKQASTCFEMLDLNGDKRISRNELTAAIRQFLLSKEPEKPGNMLFGNTENHKFTTRRTHLYA